MTTTDRTASLSPFASRWVHRILLLAAVVGVALGVETLVLHLSTDPLSDIHAYYDAGARLNAGQPLYGASIATHEGLYLYPPLLAIVFRPLAVLPFEAAAVVWESAVVGAFVLVLVRIDARRRPVQLVLCWLALPILWAVSIGQVEPILTLLLAIGSPWSIAIGGQLKLVPLLVAVHWVGRREWRPIARLGAWTVGLLLVQLALAPDATMAYLRLEWLRPAFEVRNISPFAIHPLLWVAAVGALAALALRYAPTRAGWPLAIALAVLSYPRLLVYQLTSLLAAFGGPAAAPSGHPAASPTAGTPLRPGTGH